MININKVYQRVLAFANKEQRGYITPQEFNIFAENAQLEIFEQYFYDLAQYNRINTKAGNSYEYADIQDNIKEKISIFKATASANLDTENQTNIDPTQASIYRLGTVMVNNATEVEQVDNNELLYINKSRLTAPTESRPIYVQNFNELGGVTRIIVYPLNVDFGQVQFEYIRKPQRPRWGFYVLGGKALHNASDSVNFELHPSDETELIYKILKYAGIAMVREDLSRGGQGLESMQIQQEKQ
tara:strand:+ start:16 stop:741 length:726 start_codon:yes stop_codon:yes gene_type:complete